MSTDNEELDIDVEPDTADEQETESPPETAKTNLSKRRTIDNMLEERRPQKQLADYDFDL